MPEPAKENLASIYLGYYEYITKTKPFVSPVSVSLGCVIPAELKGKGKF
ncbi:MAG: hypothetical protein HUU09_08675 [Candidatus Jettenia caeni]|nr:hypothetical protein [Candidatus Jettenia sp. AMX1]NUN23530.1 hypothetical protein [Candidatus Jettenia caeni]WKZ16595.1 MAG: hypothetical protein QY317_04640 [Candidatus Jettenia caeni]